MSNRSNKKNKQSDPPEELATMAQSFSFSIDALINIIPNFDGKKNNDIHGFLNQLDELLQTAQLPDSLKIILIKNKIVGKPHELINSSADLNEEKNYANFKNKLRQTFEIPKSFTKTQNIFMDLKQAPNQSIDDFEKLFSITAAKYLAESGHEKKAGARDLLNAIKLSKFLDSIRPDLAFEIRKSAPETYETAVKLAKQIELAFEAKNYTEESSDQANSLCDTLIKLTKTQSDQINNLQDQVTKLSLGKTTSLNKTHKGLQKWCDICKTTSHMTDNCWHNARSQNNMRETKYPRTYKNVSSRPYTSKQFTPPPHYNNVQPFYQQPIQANYSAETYPIPSNDYSPLNYQAPHLASNQVHFPTALQTSIPTQYQPQYPNYPTTKTNTQNFVRNSQNMADQSNPDTNRQNFSQNFDRSFRGHNYKNNNFRGNTYKTRTFNTNRGPEN